MLALGLAINLLVALFFGSADLLNNFSRDLFHYFSFGNTLLVGTISSMTGALYGTAISNRAQSLHNATTRELLNRVTKISEEIVNINTKIDSVKIEHGIQENERDDELEFLRRELLDLRLEKNDLKRELEKYSIK
jgi:hypothetical protein